MGETGVRVYQEDVLQGVVKQLNMTLFSGQEWVFQHDSVPAHNPRRLKSDCERTFRPLSAPRIGPRGVQTSTHGTINCGLFWRIWLGKSVTTTWTVWRDTSLRQRQRSPRDGACRDSRVTGASQDLRRGRGRPFWVVLL